jgi:hypothetical protein
MRKHWRMVSSVLLGAALLAQVPGAVSLSEQFQYLNEMSLGYQTALLLYFGTLALTGVALVLALLGLRVPALVLAALALAASVVTVPAYMASDLADGFSPSEAFRGEVLGLFTDPETGVTTFWPSTFLGGLPTWLLLIAAVIVLAMGRAPRPDDPWTGPAAADGSSSYAGYGTATGQQTSAVPTSAPPGWYADPAGGPAAYWDGQRWRLPE